MCASAYDWSVNKAAAMVTSTDRGAAGTDARTQLVSDDQQQGVCGQHIHKIQDRLYRLGDCRTHTQ